MNKPLTMIIKNTKNELARVCNESGLPPFILDLVVQGIYSEIHMIAEKQAIEDENSYLKMIDEKCLVDTKKESDINK